MEKLPSYKKVYMSIKSDIKDGVYKPGVLIPSEPELEQIFGVSRTTVRRAIELLAGEGYVRAQRGKGTEVLDISTTQRLNRLTSISETLASKGYHVTSKGMCIDTVCAPNYVAEALELPMNEEVYRVQRVQYADDSPIGIMTNYLKKSSVSGLEKYSGTFVSLYKFLEEKYGIIFTSATEYISAMVSDFVESQILQVSIGTPLLYSRRTTFVKNEPVEYAQIKLLADKYEFCVYMQGRP